MILITKPVQQKSFAPAAVLNFLLVIVAAHGVTMTTWL